MTLPLFKPEIIVSYDYVIIEGVNIPRPRRFSAKQWMDYWEGEEEGYEAGYEDGFSEGMVKGRQLG